jgi:hypothetical protein
VLARWSGAASSVLSTSCAGGVVRIPDRAVAAPVGAVVALARVCGGGGRVAQVLALALEMAGLSAALPIAPAIGAWLTHMRSSG